MNTFGIIFKISIFGESHGESLGILVDGCPAGLAFSQADFSADLARRKSGAKGTTARKELDIPLIKSGVFNGKTTGAPILVMFENADVDSSDYEKMKDTPRPGHADLTSHQKFGGFNDYRGGGHFSGRLTVGLVAAGCIAKKILKSVKIEARLVEAGGSKDIDAAIDLALRTGDSVGGVVECRISGVPAGIGEPFFDSVESVVSHAVFSIPAVKAIEFGSGFELSRLKGSESGDDIVDLNGKTSTNNSGGINGGIANGNEIVFRVAIKPTSSIQVKKKTVDLKTGEQCGISAAGRHDACIALRAPVIVEAAAAVSLVDLMLLEQKIPRVLR